jgi:hypothetical protein
MTGDIALMMNMIPWGVKNWFIWLWSISWFGFWIDQGGLFGLGFWESWIFPLMLAMLDDMDQFVYTMMDISSEV